MLLLCCLPRLPAFMCCQCLSASYCACSANKLRAASWYAPVTCLLKNQIGIELRQILLAPAQLCDTRLQWRAAAQGFALRPACCCSALSSILLSSWQPLGQPVAAAAARALCCYGRAPTPTCCCCRPRCRHALDRRPAPRVVLSEPDPDDYLHAPAECSWSE